MKTIILPKKREKFSTHIKNGNLYKLIESENAEGPHVSSKSIQELENNGYKKLDSYA